MFSVLAEQPLLISFLLGITGAALIYGYLQSGDKRLVIGGAVFFVLIPVVWMISSNIVTDREQIEQIIRDTARAVEDGDVEKAVESIDQPDTVARARAELPNYEFGRVRVGNIKIQILEGSFPLQAVADVDVSVRVSLANGSVRDQPAARRVIIDFEKRSDDRWVVTNYKHVGLTGQPDMFSNR